MPLAVDADARHPVAKDLSLRVAALAGAIAAISLLRYVTEPSFLHELSLRLYYLPILMGAYWYGAPGGLVVAVVSSVAYVHHIADAAAPFDANRYAEVVVFYLIAVSVGILANAQRRVTRRYQQAATTLASANRALQDSQEQIRRIDRLKTLGEVATGLAHEIRHPLASIHGALEIIEARAEADSPAMEFTRLAMAEVHRLDKLVWEFLKYARPHPPELRLTRLHEVIAQVILLLRVEADRAHVQIEVAQIETLDVLIDPLQIEQVLLNVLLNAIQATPAGGRIRIHEQRDLEQALLDVADQGPGIAADHVAHIFSPFFTTRANGTGLGLAIAQRIVGEHGGSLELHHSSAAGTCFRIRLPLGTPLAVASPPSLSEAAR